MFWIIHNCNFTVFSYFGCLSSKLMLKVGSSFKSFMYCRTLKFEGLLSHGVRYLCLTMGQYILYIIYTYFSTPLLRIPMLRSFFQVFICLYPHFDHFYTSSKTVHNNHSANLFSVPEFFALSLFPYILYSLCSYWK